MKVAVFVAVTREEAVLAVASVAGRDSATAAATAVMKAAVWVEVQAGATAEVQRVEARVSDEG